MFKSMVYTVFHIFKEVEIKEADQKGVYFGVNFVNSVISGNSVNLLIFDRIIRINRMSAKLGVLLIIIVAKRARD